MKHLKRGRVFGRKKNQRAALIKDLVRSLVKYEKITTTEAKAKSIKPVVEKIVTQGKNKNLATTRRLGVLLDKELAKKISEILSPRYQTRPGGYTKITKIPPRKSDGSPMAIIEFIK